MKALLEKMRVMDVAASVTGDSDAINACNMPFSSKYDGE